MKQAVILIGHGSKRPGASDAMEKLVHSLSQKDRQTTFQLAFLEIQAPDIPAAIDKVLTAGSEEIILIPYFLQGGRHVYEHIPQLTREARKKHPSVKIILAEHISFDERIASVLEDLVRKAREGSLEKA